MQATEAGFAAAFEEYQQAYGQRVTGYDVAQPTLADQPEIVLAMVRSGHGDARHDYRARPAGPR